MKRRTFLSGLPAVGLMGCTGPIVRAPEPVIEQARYVGTGPKSLTLYTMKTVRSDSGAHTALLIDASQRVMFDPAGSFRQELIPERDDVLFGMSPRLEAYYASYHARASYYVISQKKEVSPDVAEMALNQALSYGSVPQAFCAQATSSIISRLPGFESIGRTFFPNSLSDDFGRLRGVVTREYREADSDDKSVAAAQIAAQIRAGQ